MVESRWRQRAGPGLLALGLLAMLGAPSAGAGELTWAPPACPDGPIAPGAAARDAGDVTAGAAWYRLEPRLDGAGSQVGARVAVGAGDGSPARSIDLAAESFAAGPYGRFVLTGSDDGTRSTLRFVDLGAACARTIATERDVVRRAALDPTGTALFEFRVDRRTRADLGVWRRPLNGSGDVRRVLAPIAVDARFGRTFTTELSWNLEGDRLVVQSCGALACRTRLFDPATGRVALVDDDDLGEVVGVSGTRVIAYEACRGLPCPIVAVDATSGSRKTLSVGAGMAVLVDGDTGPRLVHEDWARGPDMLRVAGLDGTADGAIRIDAGGRLLPAPARAQAAVGAPRGWIAIGPVGRAATGQGPATSLRRIADGRTVVLEEASR
jgi:hypothetical protein